MKRGAPATEADVDALLEGFGSSQEVKQQCSLALERLQRDDPGGLALALALRITGAERDAEVRSYAAVLLGEVFRKSSKLVPPSGASVERGAQWLREEIGPALLEALAAAGLPMVRRSTADAIAIAALSQFQSGRAWPELTSQLARMCTGARSEMLTALEFLEVLRDEAESRDEERATAMMWVYAQLAALQEDAGALRKLLACGLMDTDVQESMVDAAARIYCFCAAGSEVPEELQLSVRDLAPYLAQAVVREPREACLQALALSASGDPTAWLQPKDGNLPAILAKAAMESTAEVAVRQAALKAMLQLLLALDASAAVDHLCDEEVVELQTHLVASIGSILAEMPKDEATDCWAEVVDGEEQAPLEDDSEVLLEDCLDQASYLIARGDEGRCALRVAAEQLLQTEAWQAKHGGLLLLLRVGLEGEAIDGDAVQAVSGVALSCFAHPHPRVRWAALEVWARLLQQMAAPLDLFDQGIDALLHTAVDAYTRVRQRGLLVLLQLSRANAQMLAKYPDAITRLLLHLAQSNDPAAKQAGAEIAELLKLSSGPLEGAFSSQTVNQVSQDGEVIEWPSDWKQN